MSLLGNDAVSAGTLLTFEDTFCSTDICSLLRKNKDEFLMAVVELYLEALFVYQLCDPAVNSNRY